MNVYLKPGDIIEVALSAVTTDLHFAWGDISDTTFLPTGYDCINFQKNTATPFTAVAAPSAGNTRKLKGASIRNIHASTPVTVVVRIDESGTETQLAGTTLQPGQTLQYGEEYGWIVFEPLAANARSRQILTATSSSTYTTPAGVRAIRVRGVGGGGGGGGVANAATNSGAAGGGGAGAYSDTLIQNPAASYTYQCGAGGTAAASGNNSGGAGGDSTFGSIMTAKGGSGGGGDTIATIHIGGAGGAGGVISTGVGDLKTEGEAGGDGLAAAAASATSGAGGRSFWGPGGQQRRNSTGAGISPLSSNSGAGASGACAISGGASQAGAAGSAGLIIVEEMV